jgi:hypothetical protein
MAPLFCVCGTCNVRTSKATKGSHTIDDQETKEAATMIPRPSWFSLPPEAWPADAREAYRLLFIGLERAKRAKLAAMKQEQESSQLSGLGTV